MTRDEMTKRATKKVVSYICDRPELAGDSSELQDFFLARSGREIVLKMKAGVYVVRLPERAVKPEWPFWAINDWTEMPNFESFTVITFVSEIKDYLRASMK